MLIDKGTQYLFCDEVLPEIDDLVSVMDQAEPLHVLFNKLFEKLLAKYHTEEQEDE